VIKPSHEAGPENPESDPIIPPVNSYGPTNSNIKRRSETARSYTSAYSSLSDEHAPLLPSSPQAGKSNAFGREISGDLIPFITFFRWFHRLFSPSARKQYRLQQTLVNEGYVDPDSQIHPDKQRKRKPISSSKHRQYMKESEEEIERNVPLETVRSLSEYFAVLESRGVVPGTSLGAMIAALQTLEDALSGLERILTTPLPWAYSVHIRHCIWIYLFFLPFQLIEGFGWYTIPGVALAAFYFLGFLAAGEEIEQPFGYDENDLDIESFVEVIGVEMKSLKTTACPNAIITHSEHTIRRHSVEETCRKKVMKGKSKRKQKEKQPLRDIFGEV